VQVDFTRQELQPGGRAEVVLRITIPDGKASLNAYVLFKLSGTLIAEQRVPLAIKIAQ